ncbi:hypothetical protein [Paucibacter sp. XJ19-41]|uniref:hypothetical protein n=1 Tax=Paucibacter sp. XJ19-41 TaxID=2927824 RepID=UPI0023496035|nr:hypothetical protein [Paucibacter sp. XJ19-41]MDC6170908.1 hypothetical protein [Paucibacter sp. XJ19-41]
MQRTNIALALKKNWTARWLAVGALVALAGAIIFFIAMPKKIPPKGGSHGAQKLLETAQDGSRLRQSSALKDTIHSVETAPQPYVPELKSEWGKQFQRISPEQNEILLNALDPLAIAQNVPALLQASKNGDSIAAFKLYTLLEHCVDRARSIEVGEVCRKYSSTLEPLKIGLLATAASGGVYQAALAALDESRRIGSSDGVLRSQFSAIAITGFKEAAALGSLDALAMLGTVLSAGDIIERNYPEALAYLEIYQNITNDQTYTERVNSIQRNIRSGDRELIASLQSELLRKRRSSQK